MEETKRHGRLIIMCTDIYMEDYLIDYTSDFYIGSYCDRKGTLSLLQDAIVGLRLASDFLPSTFLERILLEVTLLDNGIFMYEIHSPVCQENTIHILSRIIELLKENNTDLNFFCPES